MKINKLLYILPLTIVMGCEPEIDALSITGDSGDADFSTTVALGNSLTAGFQSNALRRDKQENSFPAMVAEQMRLAGGGEFSQPLMDPGVGLGVGANGTFNAEFGLQIVTSCTGVAGPSPRPIADQGQTDQLNPSTFVGANGPFGNVGVPGAKIYHLVAPGYGNPANLATGLANPYYARFSDPSNPNETMLEATLRKNASFFMLWIGNNDVLSYATSGGSGVDQTGNPNAASYGSNDITDPGLFATIYTQMISALTANGAKGAVANIPSVTSIPYFTTVPIGTNTLSQTQIDQLNAAYAAYNAGLDQVLAAPNSPLTQAEVDRRKITFNAAGQVSLFVVNDPSLTDITGINPALTNMRLATPGELMTLTLPGDSLTCGGWGTAKAIPAQFHLTADELTNINTAITAYNATIKALADANGLAFVDANAELNKLTSGGINENGTVYTSTFATGGAFSLDGVHPSTRGYAIIANLFIDAINKEYNAFIPSTDVNSFPAVE